ncbi:MAG: deoxyribonuclease IV [Ignavibacteriales bacterium]|nr:deoxyribonuclease IV [Ignavibacteriales bacterium]
MEQLLGAHTSIAGGVSTAIDRANILGFNAIQIFTKNNNQWNAKPLTDIEINNFKSKLTKSNIKIIIAHSAYLINLASKWKLILRKSREALVDELTRCEQLGIPYLNFHPGSHGGKGEEEGIKLIAEAINICHEKTKAFKVKSMLETTAGQGSSIGYKFEHLRKIIELVEDKNRVAVCIDTSHIFVAGYDIRTKESYNKVMKEFDKIVGLDLLKCIHMNDSKKDFATRVDRHEHIGRGYIGIEGFRNIMNDKRLLKIPKILETPKGKEQMEDLENIKVLKGLFIR